MGLLTKTIEERMTDTPTHPMPADELSGLPWTKVTSSNLHSIAYEDDALYVRFGSGAVYRYEVPREESYEHLLEADRSEGGSVGKAFHAHLRKAGITHKKIKITE